MRKFEALKWFNIWYEDKENILQTMYRNIQEDIRAGYNPLGECITSKLERYCYVDLKRRGVI